MSPEKQRIKIAEACGTLKWSYALPTKTLACTVPDYFNDLNTMHEAEKVLDSNQWEKWHRIIARWTENPSHATAAQRAEAFLKTLGLWEDAK